MIAKDIWMGVLSLVVISCFILFGCFIMSGAVRTTDPNLLLLIGTFCGSSGTYTGQVISYWFGTTKGSGDKNSTIATMSDKIPTSPSTQTIVATATTSNKEPAK